MSTTSELVERLRIVSDVDANCDAGSARFYFREAADRLAELERENARLREFASNADFC
jgi:hypothetical protein